MGGVHYFEQVNRENFVGNLMRQSQNTAYDNCLQDMTSRIQDTVQEIYKDLRKHIGIIRHIPKDDRENLIKVLLGLTDICKMASTSNGRSDDCVSILSLDALEPCNVIDEDLHDADQKIGKKTYTAAASIGGSWAGSALGAKGGALAGAAIGTAILPGLGTAVGGIAGGLILGVAGSYAGSSLGKWVVDITNVGE